jgi:hypothetical protein
LLVLLLLVLLLLLLSLLLLLPSSGNVLRCICRCKLELRVKKGHEQQACSRAQLHTREEGRQEHAQLHA